MRKIKVNEILWPWSRRNYEVIRAANTHGDCLQRLQLHNELLYMLFTKHAEDLCGKYPREQKKKQPTTRLYFLSILFLFPGQL